MEALSGLDRLCLAPCNGPEKSASSPRAASRPVFPLPLADLIERYTEVAPETAIWCYVDGYRGLLTGDSLVVTPDVRAGAHLLHQFGGSPIGNSRVKLTNAADCVKRGLVKEGQDPQRVAADQLMRDGVDVLHTIGGDDTNTAAADLAAFLATQRLPAHGHRPAQDDRQRRHPDPPEPRRVDGRRARCARFSRTSWPSTARIRAC